MSKLNLFDVCAVLVSKNGLEDKESQRFVKAMFDVIQEGLAEDKIVKVKGLGTFKIIEVESRESINVNTGERVLIDSHSKITFTPDSVMKEIVNKPFSQFETVVLNDGVDFPDDNVAETVIPTPTTVEKTMVDNEPLSDTNNESIADDKDVTPEGQDVAQDFRGETELESEPAAEPESQTAEPEDTDDDISSDIQTDEYEEESGRSISLFKWIAAVVIVLVFMAGAAYGGFVYGQYVIQEELAHKQMVQDLKQAETLSKKVAAANAAEQDNASVDATKIGAMAADIHDDNINKEEKSSEKAPEKALEKSSEKASEKSNETMEESHDKYAQMDARVRTGAYRIIGLDRTYKAKGGQTTDDIANRTLGPGMACYIEVFNGINSKTTIKEGQIVNIPKLQLKKKR